MSESECPRCGPDWREKHKQRFFVLRIHPKYGLMCLDAELERQADLAGEFYARRW